MYREALISVLRVLGEDDRATAARYYDLAVNLNYQYRDAEAQAYYEAALAIDRRVLGTDHPSTALARVGIAYSIQQQYGYADAEPRYREALEITRRTMGEEDLYTAVALNQLAINLAHQRKLVEAELLLQKSLSIRRKLSGDQDPGTAQSWNNLANVLNMQGNHAETERMQREALDVRRRGLGEDHPDTVLSYSHLASTLRIQGKYADAEVMGLAAAKGFETARLRIGRTGPSRASYADEQSPLYILAVLRARRGRAVDAWGNWEACLGRGLLDDMTTRRHNSLEREQQRRRDELVGQLSKLDNRIAAIRRARPLSDKPQDHLDGLEKQRLEFQGRLAELEAEVVRGLQLPTGTVSGLEQVQSHLRADVALVGWVDILDWPNAADPQGDHWACVLRRIGAPKWIRIPGTGPNQVWTKADEDRPGQVRKRLGEPSSQDWLTALTELAEQRLGPLQGAFQAQGELPRVQHLIILPSAALAGIPIEALLEARPGGPPRPVVSYVPSGTMFAWLQERRRDAAARPEQPRRLLAFGDPVPLPPNPPGPKPPDQGVLVQWVGARSIAEDAGIRAGDVLLEYAGTKVGSREDLTRKIQAAPQEEKVALRFWREGTTRAATIRPGPLGVLFDPASPASAILARREADASLHRSRGAV